MTVKRDLKEPPFPLDEEKAKACLVLGDGKLTYYINRRAKAHLLWHFWHCYAKAPYGEDPGLPVNDYYPLLVQQQEHISHSETIVLEEEHIERRNRDYPQGYRHIPNYRLDFYVIRPEFKTAFLAVRRLGRKQGTRRVTAVEIFGGVQVVLLEDAQFTESLH